MSDLKPLTGNKQVGCKTVTGKTMANIVNEINAWFTKGGNLQRTQIIYIESSLLKNKQFTANVWYLEEVCDNCGRKCP